MIKPGHFAWLSLPELLAHGGAVTCAEEALGRGAHLLRPAWLVLAEGDLEVWSQCTSQTRGRAYRLRDGHEVKPGRAGSARPLFCRADTLILTPVAPALHALADQRRQGPRRVVHPPAEIVASARDLLNLADVLGVADACEAHALLVGGAA